MLKDKILDLGFALSESEVDRLVGLLSTELESYVTKSEYEELFEENNKLKGEVSEKNTLIEDNDKLKEEKLQRDIEYLAEVNKLKIDNAIDLAIYKAGGKNLKAVKALINFNEITIDKDGVVKGIDEQIKNLTENENTKFLFEDRDVLIIKGATPVTGERTQGISKSDFQKMSYKERIDIYNKDEELYKKLCY